MGLMLENIPKVACKYQSMGCPIKFREEQSEDHFQICDYRLEKCIHSNNGCTELYYIHEPHKQIHEEKCCYQKARCLDCDDMINLCHFKDHLIDQHPRYGNLGFKNKLEKDTLNVGDDLLKKQHVGWVNNIFEIYGSLFITEFQIKDGGCYLSVTCIAPELVSCKFLCSIEVSSPKKEDLKMTIRCPVNSILTTSEEVLSSGNYLHLNFSTLKALRDSVNNIQYAVKIDPLDNVNNTHDTREFIGSACSVQ